MKYHPQSNTIIPPFNEHLFPSEEVFPLQIDTPSMQSGDTIVANTPTLDGGEYVLTYTMLPAGSPEQLAYLESRA